MNKKNFSLFAGCIAFVCAAACRNLIPTGNILFFAAACAVFAVVTVGVYTAACSGRLTAAARFGKAASVAASLLLIAWMTAAYIFEPAEPAPLIVDELLRRTIPLPLWLLLMAGGTALFLYLLHRPAHLPPRLKRCIRITAALVTAFCCAAVTYAPNIFLDIEGGTYHSHAYTNSILNVCWMIPYSRNMQSIYGHYAIFFMPFLRLFHKLAGLDYLTGIFIICAVLMGISVLLFAYVLDHFARNTAVYCLGLFSIGEIFFMLQQGGVYLQLYPHRTIFPMLLLFMAVREQKKSAGIAPAAPSFLHTAAAAAVLALAFTWSPEIGMVSMLSYAVYRWYRKAAQQYADGFRLRSLTLLLPDVLLYIVLPFGVSYLLVLAYNLAAGSPLSFREFLFPLISDRDYISNIELPMPDILHAWIPTALLFLGFSVSAFLRLLKPGAAADGHTEGAAEDPDAALHFLTGILGLGLMLYYINRPVAGALGIVILVVPLLLAALLSGFPADGLPDLRERPAQTVLRTAVVFVLFMMSFDGIWSLPSAIHTARETIWKRSELMDFADGIWTQVPPDAYAFGEGVPELLSMIDRDTYLHTTEWSLNSMPLDTMEYARKEMEGRPWFFCNMFSLYYMQENYPGLTDSYDLHEIFRYGNAEFGLFYHK